MRKRIVLIIALLIIIAAPLYAFAHPGKTDSDGGHTDSETGDYHYHHGYPAHEHRDMDGDGIPDCPYNFDDKTGWNSGTRSGGGNLKDDENEAWQLSDYLSFVFFLTSFVFLILWRIKCSDYKKLQKFVDNARKELDQKRINVEKLEKQLISDTDELRAEIKKKHEREIEKIKEEYCKKYADFEVMYDLNTKSGSSSDSRAAAIFCSKTIEELAGAPDGDYIGEDDLPYSFDKENGIYGKYSRYITAKGKCYHTRHCDGYIEYNALIVKKEFPELHSCEKCCSQLPEMDWVDRYYALQKAADISGVTFTKRKIDKD